MKKDSKKVTSTVTNQEKNNNDLIRQLVIETRKQEKNRYQLIEEVIDAWDKKNSTENEIIKQIIEKTKKTGGSQSQLIENILNIYYYDNSSDIPIDLLPGFHPVHIKLTEKEREFPDDFHYFFCTYRDDIIFNDTKYLKDLYKIYNIQSLYNFFYKGLDFYFSRQPVFVRDYKPRQSIMGYREFINFDYDLAGFSKSYSSKMSFTVAIAAFWFINRYYADPNRRWFRIN